MQLVNSLAVNMNEPMKVITCDKLIKMLHTKDNLKAYVISHHGVSTLLEVLSSQQHRINHAPNSYEFSIWLSLEQLKRKNMCA